MSAAGGRKSELPTARREGKLLHHLMVVAAGTGGHVMPGLAVAEALRERGWSVSWLGTRAGMERSWSSRVALRSTRSTFQDCAAKASRPFCSAGSICCERSGKAAPLIRARRPRVMFSTGGYVAVPAGMAASTLGVPLVLLNADAAPLMSTKMLKSLASAVLFGFEGAAAKAAGDKGLVTGNPVRAEIAQIASPEQRYVGRSGPLHLLVIGGSLGAQVLNENIPRALALVSSDLRARVVHQCGAQHLDAVRALIKTWGSTPKSSRSSTTCRDRYAKADVVVCRAGAITVSELAAAGVASVLVPLVVSTTSHQRANAEFMAANDAAIHLPQSELSAARLAACCVAYTRSVAGDGAAARSVGKPNATERWRR